MSMLALLRPQQRHYDGGGGTSQNLVVILAFPLPLFEADLSALTTVLIDGSGRGTASGMIIVATCSSIALAAPYALSMSNVPG